MYTTKSATRFNCNWNHQEASWNANVDDWNHYHREHHHHHHAYSHAHHHHHHHHLHHLQPPPPPPSTTLQLPLTISHSQPNHLTDNVHNHSQHNHHPSVGDSTNNIGHSYNNPYNASSTSGNNSVVAAVASNGTNSVNQNPSSNLNETFGPSRIEYCETYPTGTHQYQQEYSYYEQPEACNYTARQWPNQNQFSITNSVPIPDASSTVPLAAHPVQSHATLGHHPHHPHSVHPDVVAYHRYESTGQSVTNVTNNFSVNLALNIPALPVVDNTQQATVASTIQYKIQTQLEKRITITPHQLKTSQVQSSQTQSKGVAIPQESLYTRLKHYRIPKRSPALKGESLPQIGSNQAQNQNICFICGKNYARPSTLKTHLRTHSGEKPYRCHFCGKAFTQAANLTAHIRTHSGEKPFPCPICKRRFSQSSSVTTHLRIHSGERPYLCNYCRKSFSDSSTLTKHLRIHSGEKPYQCRMCTLRFSQSGNLNRHMRVHL